MAGEAKNYVFMEPVLQEINKNFVSLPENMKKQYNIYQVVIGSIIDKMKETNPLFSNLYRELFYGGSYYDGLKISKPEEYDLDLLMSIPKYTKPELSPSDLHGFVKLKLTELEKFKQQPEYKSYYTDLPKLLDDENYLDTDRVKKWMHSVITKTMNKYEKRGDQYKFICETSQFENTTFYIKVVTGGPAFTLQINNEDMKMDVDLVPCFVFDNNWPIHCNIKPNSTSSPTYFIVPKKPYNNPNDGLIGRCWRMSFQIQERELIRNKQSLKPALKLLKKLRDQLNHVYMSSYFLKTIFLLEIGNNKRDSTFWTSHVSTTFMEMLKVYHSYLTQKRIPYYWDETYNMIGHIKPIIIENYANKVGNIIKKIDNGGTDPLSVAKFFLDQQEMNHLTEYFSAFKEKSPERALSKSEVSELSFRNDSDVLRSNSSKENEVETQQQLKDINEKLNVMIKLQQSLMTTMCDLSDRVKCIEIKINSTV
nr:cyclic GMP-AMP synthase-like isoform X1 [Onthophagus taurus]